MTAEQEYDTVREELVAERHRLAETTTWAIALFLALLAYSVERQLSPNWMLLLGSAFLYVVIRLARDRMIVIMSLGSYLVWFHEYASSFEQPVAGRYHAWNRYLRTQVNHSSASKNPSLTASKSSQHESDHNRPAFPWGEMPRTVGVIIPAASVLLVAASAYTALQLDFAFDLPPSMSSIFEALAAAIGLSIVCLVCHQGSALRNIHTDLRQMMRIWYDAQELAKKDPDVVFKLLQVSIGRDKPPASNSA